MTIAVVTHTNKEPGANGGTTDAIDTSGANLLTLSVSYYTPGTAPTISDSKSNTWTLVKSQASGNSITTSLYKVENATVGTGHTFTASGIGSFPEINVASWSGVATTAQDQLSGSANNTPGTVTPTENNELVVTCLASDGTINSINGGFTILDEGNIVGGLNIGGALAYLIQTTAASANPTWSTTGETQGASAIATFKAAAAATSKFRKTQSGLGTRTGTRQLQSSGV